MKMPRKYSKENVAYPSPLFEAIALDDREEVYWSLVDGRMHGHTHQEVMTEIIRLGNASLFMSMNNTVYDKAFEPEWVVWQITILGLPLDTHNEWLRRWNISRKTPSIIETVLRWSLTHNHYHLFKAFSHRYRGDWTEFAVRTVLRKVSPEFINHILRPFFRRAPEIQRSFLVQLAVEYENQSALEAMTV